MSLLVCRGERSGPRQRNRRQTRRHKPHLTLMVDRICPLITVSARNPKEMRRFWWSCLHEVVLVPSVPINREANGQITLNRG